MQCVAAMRLLLVDGHYYLYRSFYAIRGLKNSRGEPTNAIYGYAKALRRMLADVKPDRAAVIWDCGVPARRLELQPAYKQNRPPMPDDLRPQEEWLKKNTPLFGVSSHLAPDTEADDLIASYASAAARDGADVVIATNDKDIFQIVCDRVRVYSTGKPEAGGGGFSLLGVEDVRKKWGVEPGQIGDVLALTGDASDNIPGVPGIGLKTAVALISEHGSLAALLENPAATPRIREKLLAAKELIVANRDMVRLDEDLPLPAPWQALEICARTEDLLAALRECEFLGLVREIEAEAPRRLGTVQQDFFL